MRSGGRSANVPRSAAVEPADHIAAWLERGARRQLLGHDIFVVDVPAESETTAPPLLVLHGYPTSSIDFATCVDALSADRRVVTFDMLGYGLSAKPDQRYSLFEQADLAEAVAASCGLTVADLLTHDMGDSVGGEILARSIDGTLSFDIRRRVLTNGSIYLDLVQFTDGQKFLLALPDERLDGDLPSESLVAALHAILNPDFPVDDPHLRAAAELVVRDGGGALQPRLIRYIEERRVHEGRWTGAIERHEGALAIVWGDLDPVAVYPMAERLADRCPNARFTRLEGVGHYPMIEAPERFAEAVVEHLA